MSRFEPDGTSVVVVGADRAKGDPVPLPAGTRVELRDWIPSGMVWRTGRAAQADEDLWSTVSDPVADRLRELGIRSSAASPIIVDGRLWGMVSAWTRRGPFPAGTADRLADFTELLATAVGNAQSRAELAASRTRIVAAADETRRRIERDLHDGTQQRLVSLGLELRLAQSMVPAGLPELETKIGRIADELGGAVEDLREIARGIHPAILSEGGLGPALRTLARRAAIAVELDVASTARLPEPIEVAAYYVASEALTNATKHAHASIVRVAVEERDDCLHLAVRDDGAGGADAARGSGLIGLGPSFSPSMAKIPGPASSQNNNQRRPPPRARWTRPRSRDRAQSSAVSSGPAAASCGSGSVMDVVPPSWEQRRFRSRVPFEARITAARLPVIAGSTRVGYLLAGTRRSGTPRNALASVARGVSSGAARTRTLDDATSR
jgi:signal transduction histidine kinase